MLCIRRAVGETTIINGNVTLKILSIDRGYVRLGFDAPREVPIHRLEVHERIQQEAKPCARE